MKKRGIVSDFKANIPQSGGNQAALCWLYWVCG